MFEINEVLLAFVSRGRKFSLTTGAVQLQTATKKDQKIPGRRLKLTIQSDRNDLRHVQITTEVTISSSMELICKTCSISISCLYACNLLVIDFYLHAAISL